MLTPVEFPWSSKHFNFLRFRKISDNIPSSLALCIEKCVTSPQATIELSGCSIGIAHPLTDTDFKFGHNAPACSRMLWLSPALLEASIVCKPSPHALRILTRPDGNNRLFRFLAGIPQFNFEFFVRSRTCTDLQRGRITFCQRLHTEKNIIMTIGIYGLIFLMKWRSRLRVSF